MNPTEMKPASKAMQDFLEGKTDREEVDDPYYSEMETALRSADEQWFEVTGSSPKVGGGWDDLMASLSRRFTQPRGTDRFEVRTVPAGRDLKGDPTEREFIRYTCGVTGEKID